MTSLYLEEDRSLYQESYYLLYRILKKQYTDEVTPEMVESLQWKLTPTVDFSINMKHKETGEEVDSFFMLFGSYDQESEVFSWRSSEVKNIIKDFIEDNYHMTEYFDKGACFMREVFSDTVHIKNEDHVIIPTFVRMFHKAFRLVRIITDNESDKKYYYGLIKYDFTDHTNFSKFEVGLSMYRDLVDIRLHAEEGIQNTENIGNNINISNSINNPL